ncbi:MAG: flagellar hook-associated protein FlgK [Peptostreptococcaceae bacterium]|nr:flagellar hook-associated protein FlgK [Peptostreptococcaceae bacterium]
MRSTFAGFTTARLALRASQKALDVTGQNIANINTNGYTRQRLDLVSLTVGAGTDRYKSMNNVNIGSGVLTSGLSQIRDPFLDIRFRNEIANVGAAEQKQNMLKDLESIFDEVSKQGIQNQLSEINTMLQKLSSEVGNQEFDHMVKASADVLTKMLNQYANQIEVVKNDQIYNLQQVEVPKLNDILKNIENLNKTIKANHIHGNPALELLDQRNSLIDELASYINIDVTTNREYLTNDQNGKFVDTLQIKIRGTDISLINDDKSTQFTAEKETDPASTKLGQFKFGMKNIDTDPASTREDIYEHLGSGAMKSAFDMLNKSGEFSGDNIRGIGYYEKALNLFANKVATTFNNLNAIKRPGGVIEQRYLFGRHDNDPDLTGITAKNIKIHEDWQKGKVGITPSQSGDTKGANDNILRMISSISEKQSYEANPNQPLFKGTYQEYFTNIGSVLGLDIKSTKSVMENHKTVAKEIANMRDSISSVSLDEEGMNLLHYQKSYNAAARLMTTLDEAVGTIINNMGVVGR